VNPALPQPSKSPLTGNVPSASPRNSGHYDSGIFNAAADAIFIHDPYSGAILDVNPSMLRLYGFTYKEALRLRLDDYSLGFPPYSSQEAGIWISKALHEGPQHFEWQARKKSGELFWVEIALQLAPIEGTPRIVAIVRDITQQKRTMRELEVSNQRLQLAMASVRMGSWEFDFVTRALHWSDEIFTIFEIPKQPASFELLLSLVHPDDRHLPELAMQRAIAQRSPYFGQYRMIAGGRIRWVEDRGNISYAPDGTPLLIAGVALDITDRQEAESKRFESLAQFSGFAQASQYGMGMADLDGRIIYINPTFVRMLGESSAERCLGRHFPTAYYPPEISRRLQDEILPALLRDGQWHGELELLTVDGRRIPTDENFFLIRDETGQPRYLADLATDISERRRAEAALRKEESFRRSVIERASEGLCLCHAIPEFPFVKFTVWNERMTQITGYSHEQINRLGWYQTVYPEPEYRERAIRRMEEMREGRDLIAEEWEITRADHQKRTVAISTSALPDEDGTVHVLGLMSDVTDRKRLESQMLRKQRLESIGTLAGGVAHDLNNALAPILLVTEMLRNEYPGESETVDLVENSARRGAEMVREFLTFARGVEVERRPLQPLQLFLELEKIIRSTFPKNIRLQTRYSSQVRTLVGDAAQLHQVLLNFCVNARDAMPHGGTLTLEAENVDIDALFACNVPEAVPGPHVVFRIRDTGLGIPPENLERIFDPFFSTKGPDRGSGLGLSTALGIVRSHGGFIQVDSAPGLGSCFSAYLPVAETGASVPESSAPSPILYRGNGETILLVDDETAVREAGCAVLRRLNFRPLSATDGADGIARAGQHVHELRAIITDLHMPYLDGLAFVRVIRKMLPTLPIAVATGRIESSVTREFEALGVKHWLNKPFSESQLAETLHAMLAPED
jgi:PAS domain S-box-containing protein